MNTGSNPQALQQIATLACGLSSERDPNQLLHQIVEGCLDICRADGGTIYTLSENDPNILEFRVLRNRSLNLNQPPVDLRTVTLTDEQGVESRLVAVQTFLRQRTFNITDVYRCDAFDFSGTLAFDRQLGYRSRSFLSVPLKDHEDEMIGVLQLINALDERGGVVPFSDEQEQLVNSLASMAASVLTKQILIDAQKTLFESFIKMIGQAIDHKSPVTGKHCELVPEIALRLAEAVNQDESGCFAEVRWSEQEMYELKVAAWMHDCGKITTPESIIDKATKLHSFVDRIEVVAGRFREYKLHLELALLRQCATLPAETAAEAQATFSDTCRQLDDDLAFLRVANIGGEFMASEDRERVESISRHHWSDNQGVEHWLLTEDEVAHLSIPRGTLTEDERQIMRDHIKVTINMLEALPYPRNLNNVPEIACNHHEYMDGSGYPRGLSADELSLRARIMCIADIFEALTAPDRPYKQGMKLSQAMTIIGRMVEDGRLDADLFRLFFESGVYMEYAREHMAERQIDRVDPTTLPGLR